MVLSPFTLSKYFGIRIWKIQIDLRTEHPGQIESVELVMQSAV